MGMLQPWFSFLPPAYTPLVLSGGVALGLSRPGSLASGVSWQQAGGGAKNPVIKMYRLYILLCIQYMITWVSVTKLFLLWLILHTVFMSDC